MIMRMNKKRAYVVTTLCIVFALLLILITYLRYMSKHNIYDNEKLIATKEDYYSAAEFQMSPLGENRWNVSVEKLSGAITLQSFSVSESDEFISFSTSMEVFKGEFKIVLVDTDNEIVIETIFDDETNVSLDKHKLAYGNYAIKAVGTKAKIEGDFTLILSGDD